MNELSYTTLWSNIRKELDARKPKWQELIEHYAQVSAAEAREQGHHWTNEEIFEGIVRAVLSNQTDWAKIDKVLPELESLFRGFSLQYFADLDEGDINKIFVPWFQARKAGSMTLKRNFVNLIAAAQKLLRYSQSYGSLNSFLDSLWRENNFDAKLLVKQLGSASSQHKLPALGIPIAAEALRNIGFDLAKPDRHINRAMGCFGLVKFSRWQKNKSRTAAPLASEEELMKVMETMEKFAKDISVRVSFLDNSIWILCAKSGLFLSNEELECLALYH